MSGLGQFYVGNFRHNLDAKKRLTIPSKWRFEGDVDQTYVALPDPAGCITVLPPRAVSKYMEKLEEVSLGDAEAQQALQQLLAEACSFTIDKQGRINIDERLYRYAAIGKQVVLAGVMNTFKLWEPERYDAYMGSNVPDLGQVLKKLKI